MPVFVAALLLEQVVESGLGVLAGLERLVVALPGRAALLLPVVQITALIVTHLRFIKSY